MMIGSGTNCRRVVAACLLCACGLAGSAQAQSALTGIIHDPSGGVAVGAVVVLHADAANRYWKTTTSPVGYYEIELPPGDYEVFVWLDAFSYQGFVRVYPNEKDALDIELSYRSEASVRVSGDGSTGAGGPAPNVLGGHFSRIDIEAILLQNGRTLQSLQTLVPGIVFTDSTGNLAQFTTLGQRRFSNRMTIDGIDADLAVDLTAPGIGQAGSGALPAFAQSGGTQTLAPFSAIEEVQVRTAARLPEHQKTPGAQTAIVTRSGGDQFAGSAFMDLRPSQLAASDWFANAGQMPKQETDYWTLGGSAGGPLVSRRLFFFGAFERQNIERSFRTTIRVPSEATRETASASAGPLLDSFPLPNGRDVGQGLAELSEAFPVRSDLSDFSMRVDANVSLRHRVFARVNAGDSSGDALGSLLVRLPAFSFARTEATRTRTATAGLNSILFSSGTNELRANVSVHRGTTLAAAAPDAGGESLLMDSLVPEGVRASDAWVAFNLFPGNGGIVASGREAEASQQQIQLADSVAFARGRHEWRFGMDYRRVRSATDAATDRYTYRFAAVSDLLQGRVRQLVIQHVDPGSVLRQAWSAFAQDSVRVTPRLSVEMGLRYGVNPAPRSGNEIRPLLLRFDQLPNIQEEMDGSLWNTSWSNVAPRIGAAYQLTKHPGRESQVRAGLGLTFDELASPGAVAFGRSYPYVSTHSISLTTFPVSAGSLSSPFPAPFSTSDLGEYYAFPRNLRSPKTYSWNVGLEQALGATQRVALSYVGAAGRDLIYWQAYYVGNPRPVVYAYSNNATSDYHALLAEYVRRLSHGLQWRTVYTFGHAIDTDSGESTIQGLPASLVPLSTNRASADFDRRHVLETTGSYRIPSAPLPGLFKSFLSDWQADVVGRFQSGAPVAVSTVRTLPSGPFALRPDPVPGVPVWIADASAPGRQRINPDAFVVPSEPRQGLLGRNTLRASWLRQVDLSLSRSIPLGSRVTARLRVDALNIFNVPNFGAPYGALDTPQFGRPYESYANALGTGTLGLGGLTPIQQVGGPRTIQLGIRLSM